MDTLRLGAGIGAVILIVLWIVALALCCVSLRTRYNIGPIAVILVLCVTLLLLSIPRGDDEKESSFSDDKVLEDPLFVWRTSIALFLGMSSILTVCFTVITHIIEIKQARPIKSWYLQS